MVIVVNDTALTACDAQYDRVGLYSVHGGVVQQRSGSTDRD